MINSLFESLQLGNVEDIKAVSGGLLHEMYDVKTSTKRYAVKKINNRIYQKNGILDHYEASESFAHTACQSIKGVAAMKFKTYIQDYKGSAYIIYPWFDGQMDLKPSLEGVFKVGQLLASLHNLSYKEKVLVTPIRKIDWYEHEAYLSKEDLKLLSDIESTMMSFESKQIYSHRDLDPKNIMWKESQPYIIDWESCDYIDPDVEAIEGAVYFSYGDGTYDLKKFQAYLKGYRSLRTIKNPNLALAHIFSSKLGWLEHLLIREQNQVREMMDLLATTYKYLEAFKQSLNLK